MADAPLLEEHAPAEQRYGPGRGSAVTPEERREIQLDHLVHSLSRRRLAAKYGRTRETIGHLLSGEDFEALKQQAIDELKQDALLLMSQNIKRAAVGWTKAIDVASDRGDHKPAKDLLLYTDTIQPIGEDRTGQGITIQVGIALPGTPQERME